jgi:hypothetical protein
MNSIRPIDSNSRLGQRLARRWRGNMGSDGKILWNRPDSVFQRVAGPAGVEVYLHKPRSRGPPRRTPQDIGNAKAGTSLRSASTYFNQPLMNTSARPSSRRTSLSRLDLANPPVPA